MDSGDDGSSYEVTMEELFGSFDEDPIPEEGYAELAGILFFDDDDAAVSRTTLVDEEAARTLQHIAARTVVVAGPTVAAAVEFPTTVAAAIMAEEEAAAAMMEEAAAPMKAEEEAAMMEVVAAQARTAAEEAASRAASAVALVASTATEATAAAEESRRQRRLAGVGGEYDVVLTRLARETGLTGLLDFDFEKVDHALINAFVERWYPETNSFHFPWDEITITLHGVTFLLGLRIEGYEVNWMSYGTSIFQH
ncbi:hypothetical protein V2J09_000004 [Rumex salicifolius]